MYAFENSKAASTNRLVDPGAHGCGSRFAASRHGEWRRSGAALSSARAFVCWTRPGRNDLIQRQLSLRCGWIYAVEPGQNHGGERLQLQHLLEGTNSSSSLMYPDRGLTQRIQQDGALWVYPDTTRVIFKGLNSLVEYKFGPKMVCHGFCGICGVAIRERFLADGATDTALNVRTMNGLDVAALEIIKLDGKADFPAYEVPE